MRGQSPKVYREDAYAYRVAFAAAVIARKGACTRVFDTCFEMHDGAAVSAALVRRAKANPTGPLALNLFSYIDKERTELAYEETKHLSLEGLSNYARKLRAQAKSEFRDWWNAQYAAGHVANPYPEEAAAGC